MPNELTYKMPQIAWLTLWSGNVPYLCHVATRVVACSSTHVIHMKTAWGPLASLQKARWKPNLDNVDRSDDKARASQNLVADVQVGQDRGVGIGETGNPLHTSILVVSKIMCRKYFSY
jgi:hypothetical protein